MEVKDVIIVGGGPAGLNAAIVLSRCLRSVLLFDTQEYRNRFSHGMHNYLTRDDILPTDFISLCHTELDKYGVNLIKKRITHARKDKDGLFIAKDEDGTLYYAKKMLIGHRSQRSCTPGARFPGIIWQICISLSLLRWLGGEKPENWCVCTRKGWQ